LGSELSVPPHHSRKELLVVGLLSVQPHHSRKALLVASIQEDAREMVAAVHFYKEHLVQMQEQITAILEASRVAGQQAPTLEDVKTLGFLIFSHGPIVRPKVGGITLRDVPHHHHVITTNLIMRFLPAQPITTNEDRGIVLIPT
jgi:hypothetical protein